MSLQITQQVYEQAEGPPLTLTAVSGQSISLTTDMLKVGGCLVRLAALCRAVLDCCQPVRMQLASSALNRLLCDLLLP